MNVDHIMIVARKEMKEIWINKGTWIAALFFALFFYMLYRFAQARGTNDGYLPTLRIWIILQAVLFVVFTVLVYVMSKGFMTIYGAVYLLSLFLALGVIIRMRKTVEAI